MLDGDRFTRRRRRLPSRGHFLTTSVVGPFALEMERPVDECRDGRPLLTRLALYSSASTFTILQVVVNTLPNWASRALHVPYWGLADVTKAK